MAIYGGKMALWLGESTTKPVRDRTRLHCSISTVWMWLRSGQISLYQMDHQLSEGTCKSIYCYFGRSRAGDIFNDVTPWRCRWFWKNSARMRKYGSPRSSRLYGVEYISAESNVTDGSNARESVLGCENDPRKRESSESDIESGGRILTQIDEICTWLQLWIAL